MSRAYCVHRTDHAVAWVWSTQLINTSETCWLITREQDKTAKINGEIHIKGAKVPGNESSTEQKFHRTFVPGSEKTGEWKGLGAKVPGNELATEQKGQGAKGPRSESSWERIGQGPIGRFALGSELALERKGSVPVLANLLESVQCAMLKACDACADMGQL